MYIKGFLHNISLQPIYLSIVRLNVSIYIGLLTFLSVKNKEKIIKFIKVNQIGNFLLTKPVLYHKIAPRVVEVFLQLIKPIYIIASAANIYGELPRHLSLVFF